MLTPTLFAIATITSLRPTGERFNPNFMTEDSIGFDGNRVTFTNYILDHHNQDTDEVSNEEQIAFLELWLSQYIFCSKSLQVANKYLNMEHQLHVGHKLCLSQMILGCLYESLGKGVKILKNFRPGSKLLLAGPYWLLQLWLNATFESSLSTHNIINKEADEIKNRRAEGTHLVQLTPNDSTSDKLSLGT